MTYRIKLSRQARNAVATLPVGVVSAIVEFIYGPLAENPRRVGKPLTNELTGTYSARRGSYRILYRLDDDLIVVEVIKIGHRGDVSTGTPRAQ